MSSSDIAMKVAAVGESRSMKEGKPKPMEIVAFGVVVILWAAFAIALVFSQSSIHDAWQWFMDQPVVLQVPLGLLFLPWVIAVWVWETSWHIAARGVVVAGVAWVNILTFSPWSR